MCCGVFLCCDLDFLFVFIFLNNIAIRGSLLFGVSVDFLEDLVVIFSSAYFFP